MTEKGDDKDVPEQEKVVSTPLAGERLAAIRREKKISVLEVAKELHLDEPKVRALERNEFDVLGAPVFAKGHLKKYAQLVEVSVDDIIADYYSLNRADTMPPLVGRARLPVREIRLGRWLLLLLLLVIAAGVYWWFFAREAPRVTRGETSGQMQLPGAATSAPAAADTQVPKGVAEAEDAAELDTAPAAESESETMPVPEPDAATDAAIAPLPDAASSAAIDAEGPVAAGEVRVSLNFIGDCWTEISDASGERLFFALGKEGRSVSVTGAAPLSILLGNADNVELKVNDAAYRPPPGSRRGNSARFTINAR
ncbi:MAG TPA: DUF4115 domain-containing protein [Woeseiaceae bacterium]|nr:DUF4115 domain-containing protein [Woeseiaceae bacterium]